MDEIDLSSREEWKEFGKKTLRLGGMFALGVLTTFAKNHVVTINKLDLNHDRIDDICVTIGIPYFPSSQQKTYFLGTSEGTYKPLYEIKKLEIEKAQQQIEMKYDSLIKR